MTPDELIAAFHRASVLGEQAARDAQRYADARCVALLALAVEHGESSATIAARIGVTRARVQQMTARGRRVVAEKPFFYPLAAAVGLTADLAVGEGKTRVRPIADDIEFAAVVAKVNAGCNELERNKP